MNTPTANGENEEGASEKVFGREVFLTPANQALVLEFFKFASTCTYSLDEDLCGILQLCLEACFELKMRGFNHMEKARENLFKQVAHLIGTLERSEAGKQV